MFLRQESDPTNLKQPTLIVDLQLQLPISFDIEFYNVHDQERLRKKTVPVVQISCSGAEYHKVELKDGLLEEFEDFIDMDEPVEVSEKTYFIDE